jgi:hypothetical protein
MLDLTHFARLDGPSDAFRAACGAWRERANWTTTPARITCPACRKLVEARREGPRIVVALASRQHLR